MVSKLKRIGPWSKPSIEECAFYHTFDLEHRTVYGAWDIRGLFDQYIGHYPIQGKTVLDIGTASGFLAFSMEQAGAHKVLAFDVDSLEQQDRVPFKDAPAYRDKKAWSDSGQIGLVRQKNSFWYMWHEFHSSVDVYYASLSELAKSDLAVDVVVAGAILEHLANPIDALGIFARLAVETVIVAHTPIEMSDSCYMRPLIEWNDSSKDYVWWCLTSKLYETVFGNLGFEAELIPSIARMRTGTEVLEVPRHTVVARRRR